MKVAKYEFNTLEELNIAVDSLGENHKHVITKPFHAPISPTIYDENGEVLTEAVVSDKYSVDVQWKLNDSYDENGEIIKVVHPTEWLPFAIEITEGNGFHSFKGIDYQCCKIETN